MGWLNDLGSAAATTIGSAYGGPLGGALANSAYSVASKAWTTPKRTTGPIATRAKAKSPTVSNNTGSNVLRSLGGAGANTAFSLGEKYLTDKYIGQPQADRAYGQSKESSAKAWKRSYGAYKRRYQDTSRDMKKAGLNPILAASGGFNVGSGTQAVSAQAFKAQQPQSSASQNTLNFAKTSQSGEETKRAAAQTKLTQKQAVTEVKKAQKIVMENRVLKQQEAEVIERTSLLMEQQAKTNAEWKLSNKKREQIILLNQQVRITLKKLKAQGNVYNGKYGEHLMRVRETLGAIGALIQGVPVQLMKTGH